MFKPVSNPFGTLFLKQKPYENKNKKKHEKRKQFEPVFRNRFLFLIKSVQNTRKQSGKLFPFLSAQ
jgi:hypothetical protein